MNRLVLCIIITLITTKATAQLKVEQVLSKGANPEEPSISAQIAIKQIGKEVYVCDKLDRYSITNDTLKLLYIGDRSLRNSLLVVLKGKKLHFNPSDFQLSKMRISGKVVIYNNVPAIIVTSDTQLAKHIQI
jgi:hypothetical protein